MSKLNVDKLREKLAGENKKGGKANDPRFLNYFDMKPGEKMIIRLLPAPENDDIYLTYAMHGPNLDVNGVKSIRCLYESSNKSESCPGCTKSYGLYQDDQKDEAKKWRSKESYLAQCIVVKSPIEIKDPEDGNPVKILHLPYKVKELIKQAIVNGQIDDPCERNFVLVKGTNPGNRATYEHSFFEGKDSDLPEEILEAFEAGLAYTYDLEAELPAVATAEELEEWVEKAEAKASGKNPSRSSNRSSSRDDSTDQEEEKEESQDDDEPPAKEEGTKASAMSLRERLAARKRQ